MRDAGFEDNADTSNLIASHPPQHASGEYYSAPPQQQGYGQPPQPYQGAVPGQGQTEYNPYNVQSSYPQGYPPGQYGGQQSYYGGGGGYQ